MSIYTWQQNGPNSVGITVSTFARTLQMGYKLGEPVIEMELLFQSLLVLPDITELVQYMYNDWERLYPFVALEMCGCILMQMKITKCTEEKMECMAVMSE
jgi:hypothetical protein